MAETKTRLKKKRESSENSPSAKQKVRIIHESKTSGDGNESEMFDREQESDVEFSKDTSTCGKGNGTFTSCELLSQLLNDASDVSACSRSQESQDLRASTSECEQVKIDQMFCISKTPTRLSVTRNLEAPPTGEEQSAESFQIENGMEETTAERGQACRNSIRSSNPHLVELMTLHDANETIETKTGENNSGTTTAIRKAKASGSEERKSENLSKSGRKSSTRLRRRSGESWAVRYEKDFILTPLAKLSKDDATFLPPRGTAEAAAVLDRKTPHELRSKGQDHFRTLTLGFGDPEDLYSPVPLRRLKKKHNKKCSNQRQSGRCKNVKKKGSSASPSCVPGLCSRNKGVSPLTQDAAIFSGSEAVNHDLSEAVGSETENRRSTRSTPLLCDETPLCTRRRKHSGEELLNDSRMQIHACAIWSSENRRHFQMSHPQACGEVLDNLMRCAWEELSKGDKLRYMQRASNALKDRNKYSNRTSPKESSTDKEGLKDLQTEMDKFCVLQPEQQWRILKNKMSYFQGILFSGEYHTFLQDYKSTLRSMIENMKLRPSGSPALTSPLEIIARRLLFSKIKQYEVAVEEKRKQRYLLMRQEAERRFHSLVMDTLNDENLWKASADSSRGGHVPNSEADEGCDALGQVLKDLREIHVYGTTQWTMQEQLEIKKLAEQLMASHKPQPVPSRVGEPTLKNNQTEQSLLREVCSSKVLPVLNPSEVEQVLSVDNNPGHCAKPASSPPAENLKIPVVLKPFMPPPPPPPPHLTFHDYVSREHLHHPEPETCCELDSPSCVLTTALVTERLTQQAARIKQVTRHCTAQN